MEWPMMFFAQLPIGWNVLVVLDGMFWWFRMQILIVFNKVSVNPNNIIYLH
jgi:hypothetical protein